MTVKQLPFFLLLAWTFVGCAEDSPLAKTQPPVLVLPDILQIEESESEPPLPVPPGSLGPGFTDLSEPIEAEEPFPLYAGGTEPGDFSDSTGGIFADLDQDGFPEVILGNLNCCPFTNRSKVFRYNRDSESLEYSLELSQSLNNGLGMVTGAVDLDEDGWMDLFAAQGSTGILWGVGPQKFSKGMPYPTPPGDPTAFQHLGALHFFDLDQDGWLDMLAGDARCGEDALTLLPILRVGPQSLQAVPEMIVGQSPPSNPYAVLAAPYGAGKTMLFASSRPCSNAEPNNGFFLSTERGSDGYPRFVTTDLTAEDSVYKEDPEVSFGPLPLASPMAAMVGDINADGILDFATTLKQSYGIFAGAADGLLYDRSHKTLLSAPYPTTPWGFALLDIDRDGRQDLIVAHGESGDPQDAKPDAPQPTRVLWNAEAFRFQDISALVGDLGRAGNWRSMAVGDLDRDGDPDFIIGGMGLYPRVYRNDVDSGNNGFAIALKGHTSNHLGIGATIRINVGNGTPTQLHVMNHMSNPLSTSEALVFVGTGKATSVADIQIEWPSGHFQTHINVPSEGVQTFEEPPIVTLSDESRQLPADGLSEMIIHVQPYLPDGVKDGESSVSIDLLAGPGTFTGPTVFEDGSWQRTLRAPTSPGSSVIEIAIGGKTLGIMPRIWWQ